MDFPHQTWYSAHQDQQIRGLSASPPTTLPLCLRNLAGDGREQDGSLLLLSGFPGLSLAPADCELDPAGFVITGQVHERDGILLLASS